MIFHTEYGMKTIYGCYKGVLHARRNQPEPNDYGSIDR